jgi:8-oxo-dGTP pyrophosphatase MutT (NUDIX family)
MSNPSPYPDAAPGARRGAVAVIVREGRFLVIRRSRHVVAPSAYCFPGGEIEPGESEEEALVREISEELRVRIRPIRRLWQSITPWDVALTWWHSELDAAQAITPNPAEVESVHWLTPDEMTGLSGLLESNHAFLDALAAGEVAIGVLTREDDPRIWKGIARQS